MKRATTKKLTRSFDIDAAVVDTIYGARGRIKSPCLLFKYNSPWSVLCFGQILNYDRYRCFVTFGRTGFALLSWGDLIGAYFINIGLYLLGLYHS